MLSVAFYALGFLSSGFIIFSALTMRSLPNYTLARIAAVIALIPLATPFCRLGIPFGVLALISLLRSDVRKAFQASTG